MIDYSLPAKTRCAWRDGCECYVSPRYGRTLCGKHERAARGKP